MTPSTYFLLYEILLNQIALVFEGANENSEYNYIPRPFLCAMVSPPLVLSRHGFVGISV